MDLKRMLGEWVASRLKDGEVIGVGTGSTVEAVLAVVGERISRDGLRISAISTSLQSTECCLRNGIQVLESVSRLSLAWGFDGADAVDQRLRAIKGKGGAMLREKIMASRCVEYIILIDESKLVDNIAAKAAVPIEVVPESQQYVRERLLGLGAVKAELRGAVAKHGAVVTESGNLIIDAVFEEISDSLEAEIKTIVGVVESGLFLNFADKVVVSSKAGIRELVKQG